MDLRGLRPLNMRSSVVEGASTLDEDEAEGVSVNALSLSTSTGSEAAAAAAAAASSKRRQNIVNLNVGGKKFSTTLSTLTKTHSMLAVMFSGRFAMTMDEKNRFFIDRDGKHFGTILNYLRDGFVVVPDSPQAKHEVTLPNF